MKRSNTFTMRLAVAIAAGTSLGASADDVAPRGPLLPLYAQECGSCHVAFAPGLLPAQSWQRIIGRLHQHFGINASVDDASAKTLLAWLDANAATSRKMREVPPQDRITRADWFVREHREVPSDAWKLPTVRSPANCEACHPQAAHGSFREPVRIPQ